MPHQNGIWCTSDEKSLWFLCVPLCTRGIWCVIRGYPKNEKWGPARWTQKWLWSWLGRPLFLEKARKTTPKRQGFFLSSEPLTSLGKKGKTLKKTRKFLATKKARKSQKARKGRSGYKERRTRNIFAKERKHKHAKECTRARKRTKSVQKSETSASK